MMPTGQLTARILDSADAPPTVVQRKGTEVAVTLNFNPTIPEIILMTFLRGGIQHSFAQRCDIHYIGNSEAMQNNFNTWVKTTFPQQNFTPEQLKLTDLVASIWSKTKEFIDNELSVKKNPHDIENEKQWQSQAAIFETDFRAGGHLGKVFTSRQANLILNSLASIERGV